MFLFWDKTIKWHNAFTQYCAVIEEGLFVQYESWTNVRKPALSPEPLREDHTTPEYCESPCTRPALVHYQHARTVAQADGQIVIMV